jgi:hypothetical protein
MTEATHYMVFSGYRQNEDDGITWSAAPVGVFRAGDPEAACKAAARKHGRMGSYFALEGFAWGVDMLEVEDVEELGQSPRARLDDLESRLAANRALLEKAVGVGLVDFEHPASAADA